ncbi:MAG: hypothetical protein KC468_13820 [Myxococcales bacterium]|nr:hypothetical protein [Myxococcales bacterium]
MAVNYHVFSDTFLRALASAIVVTAIACAPGRAPSSSSPLRVRPSRSILPRERPPRGVTVEVVRPGPAVSFHALAIGPEEIWVSGAGAELVRAVNTRAASQITWASGQIGDDPAFVVRDLEAVDRATVVALAVDEAGRSRIFRSDDVGVTWTMVFQASQAEGAWRALAMWPYRDEGVALGDPVNGRFAVLTTHDAGRTWRRPDPAEQRVVPPEALPGERLLGSAVAVGPTNEVWFGTGGSAARVFRSDDSGLTWEVADAPLAHGHERAGVHSISFLTRTIGIAVGGDPEAPDERTGTAAWTFDSGYSWAAKVEENPAGFRSAVVFTHVVSRAILGTTAVAVGPNGADLSLDCGRTWHPMPAATLPGEGAVELNAVAAESGGLDFLAAGTNGAIALYKVPFRYKPPAR